jgi:hypothetical protein
LDACKKKYCKWVEAEDGAVCDVNPCVQGNCFNGKCCGGSAATCPEYTDDCKRVGGLG